MVTKSNTDTENLNFDLEGLFKGNTFAASSRSWRRSMRKKLKRVVKRAHRLFYQIQEEEEVFSNSYFEEDQEM